MKSSLMKKLLKILWLVVLPILSSQAIAQAAPKGLDIYFIDVEGGAATLIVTPAESPGWRLKSPASNRSITVSSLIGIAITWVVFRLLRS